MVAFIIYTNIQVLQKQYNCFILRYNKYER